MNIFEKYANYYDLLNKDKNYSSECDMLEQIFQDFAPSQVRSILDLGCGTGGHASILASRGYTVTGVDMSETMLSEAIKKSSSKNTEFVQGDLRDLDLGRKFDTVISMFAVMGYMISNEDLAMAFRTVRRHLNPGGLFVFDSWFGPGVFHEPPTVRQKELIDNGKRVIRTATPTFDIVEQVIDVRFDITEINGNKTVEDVTEHHLIRPLFAQEARQFAKLNGMELLAVFPWMDMDRNIELTDWLACFVLRAT